MEHAEVVRRMILFDKGDARRIQHFLKVYMFSAMIGTMENLPPEQQEILEIAAILHDIGIHPAEKNPVSAMESCRNRKDLLTRGHCWKRSAGMRRN